ncbi:MAG: hypothetical protein N3H31_07385 [Candidatus Nezhaarchaeota archaeon]|nr:hypothetical protein [Candidatus Nezhaarchaeota archaeon]
MEAAALAAGLGLVVDLARELGGVPIVVGGDFVAIVFYAPALSLLLRWAWSKLRARPASSSS